MRRKVGVLACGFAGLIVACTAVGCGKSADIGFHNIVVNNAHKASATDRTAVESSAAPKIVVTVSNGSIKVTKGEKPGVEVEFEKTAHGESGEEAQANLKKIETKVSQEKDAIVIDVPPIRNLSFSVDVRIAAPPGSQLELKSQFGGVTAIGIEGAINASSSNGSVDVKGCRGPVEIKSDFGSLAYEGSSKIVAAKTSNGAVKIHHQGDGAIEAESNFGAIEVDAEAAAVKARSSNGAVDVKGGTGSVSASSDFGQVTVKGKLVRVEARSSNGAVEFAGSLAEGNHSLESNFGSVKATLPADAALDIDAKTDFGSIHSDFDVVAKGELGKSRVQGAIGGQSKTTLKMHTNNGSIELKKSGR